MRQLFELLSSHGVHSGYENTYESSWLAHCEAGVHPSVVQVEQFSAFYRGPYFVTPKTSWASICTMGAFSYSHSALHPLMIVGRYCSIATGLQILDFAHPLDRISTSIGFFFPEGDYKPLPLAVDISDSFRRKGLIEGEEFDPTLGLSYPVIEHDVWIGKNVTLAMGITIGTGAVVAANSVVTKSVAPYSIVAGVPAKEIRQRFDSGLSEALLESQWWDFDYSQLRELDFFNPSTLLKELSHKNLQSADFPKLEISRKKVFPENETGAKKND